MIYVNIPYCPKEKGQNIGFAYNTFMGLLGEDDWACFLDHDAMFTTINWYHQLEDIIKKHPNIGLFSCMTNRIGNFPQKLQNIDENNHDMKYHRLIGKQLQDTYYDQVRTEHLHHLISGVMVFISKKSWEVVGGFMNGFLGVDNDIHQKCINHNIQVGIMNGVYTYHWYRGDGNLTHLK
tara:strand:- start:25 stop:561 length:537 start_codon:yes stop_codon:yes gene_type:complete